MTPVVLIAALLFALFVAALVWLVVEFIHDLPRLLIAALMWLAFGAVTVALAWLVVLLGAVAGM